LSRIGSKGGEREKVARDGGRVANDYMYGNDRAELKERWGVVCKKRREKNGEQESMD